MHVPEDHRMNPKPPYTIHYQEFAVVTRPVWAQIHGCIGADGANSRVAKAMDASEYNFVIAIQERNKINDDQMKFYEEMTEM